MVTCSHSESIKELAGFGSKSSRRVLRQRSITTSSKLLQSNDDPANDQAASRMTHFPPSPSVLAPVLLTRVAYAQLQGQVFHPPRVFGPEWHVAEGEDNGEDEKRWRDLGVKISTGFEIMYREGGKRRGGAVSSSGLRDF